MEDDGPGVWPCDGPSADDGYCDFVLDDDDDLCIDIETLNRILDEHPETAEGSRGDSSGIDSSTESGKFKNSLSQSGSQVTDWAPSRDDLSCSLKASDTGTGVHSCSFHGQRKVELGQSSSPAYTSSASLNDWFSLSHGGQCAEHCGVSPSEMTSFSTVSSSMDRDTAYFSNNGGNVVFNPVNCEARTVSKCESDKNDSKFVAFRPYEVNPYLNGVPEYGSGTTGTSESSFRRKL